MAAAVQILGAIWTKIDTKYTFKSTALTKTAPNRHYIGLHRVCNGNRHVRNRILRGKTTLNVLRVRPSEWESTVTDDDIQTLSKSSHLFVYKTGVLYFDYEFSCIATWFATVCAEPAMVVLVLDRVQSFKQNWSFCRSTGWSGSYWFNANDERGWKFCAMG